MSFISMVWILQIKRKSGQFRNTGDEILKWENNGNFMVPFGKTSHR